MDEIERSAFGTMDFCMFGAVLLISLAIGVYTSITGTKSPEEFLMGNRSFGPIPIAMSLLTSFVSAISLLGYSGEAYAHGIQVSTFVLGIGIGISIAAVVTIPVIFPLKLTSVNEYLELRFKSTRLRKAIMIITSIKGIFYMGVCLYAPTVALSAVTPISSISYIFILGGVVTIYSTIGGIRAVVWTDVFQLTVMLLGTLVIVIAGLVEIGGLSELWRTAVPGGRLSIFNMSLNIYERHTFINTFSYGVVIYSALYGVSQINVQRLCSVSNIKDVYRILIMNTVGMFIIYVIIFGGGIIAYVAYHGCDPLSSGVIEKKEEIMPYFVVDKLQYLIGLPGVFVATLLGGALSSLSSVISAQVAMFWEDFCRTKTFFAQMKPARASLMNKLFCAITGVINIGMALIASKATSLIQFSMSISGVTFGGIYGVFLLGLLSPTINVTGVWAGLATSCITLAIISGGSFFYGKDAVYLPFSIEYCPFESANFSEIVNSSSTQSVDFRLTTPYSFQDNFEERDIKMYFFGISYTWYSLFGTILCVTVGLIVSKLTGGEDIRNISPKYVTPFMRRFYWTKEELEKYEMEEQEKLILDNNEDPPTPIKA